MQFLKDNATRLRAAIAEIFAGSEGVELKGKLVYFGYADKDCSDLRDLGSEAPPENYGPGIRMSVIFPGMEDLTLRFFYAERQCTNMTDTIDNINTDFGMAQIMYGQATRSLGIVHYDLNENLICFKVGSDEVELEAFNQCWDVNNLTFNVKMFLALKSNAEKKSNVSYRYRGVIPVNAESVLPPVVPVLGIDKAAFLNQANSDNRP